MNNPLCPHLIHHIYDLIPVQTNRNLRLVAVPVNAKLEIQVIVFGLQRIIENIG